MKCAVASAALNKKQKLRLECCTNETNIFVGINNE